MKTVLVLLALASLSHAGFRGQQAYVNAAINSSGSVDYRTGTYQIGWATGLTPDQARQHAAQRYYLLPASERAAWDNAGQTTRPSQRIITPTPDYKGYSYSGGQFRYNTPPPPPPVNPGYQGIRIGR